MELEPQGRRGLRVPLVRLVILDQPGQQAQLEVQEQLVLEDQDGVLARLVQELQLLIHHLIQELLML